MSWVNQRRASGVGSSVGTTLSLRRCPRRSHLNTFCLVQEDQTLLEMDLWVKEIVLRKTCEPQGLLRSPVRGQLANQVDRGLAGSQGSWWSLGSRISRPEFLDLVILSSAWAEGTELSAAFESPVWNLRKSSIFRKDAHCLLSPGTASL